MQYEMTLYIADRKTNGFMKHFDLCPNHKCYIKRVKVRFQTTSKVDEKYFLDLIEKSKTEKEKWVPAIEFCGTVYHDPEIKEISDGNQVFFVGK